MANIFRVSKKEVRFLLCFEEIEKLIGFDELIFVEEKEWVKEAAESLLSKRYIFMNEEGECLLQESFVFLWEVIKNPKAYFVMKSNQEKIFQQVIYFVKDSIVLVSWNGIEFEFVWIPFIHFAIGAVAETLTPFKNRETIKRGEYLIGEKEEIIEKYINRGYEIKWEFLGVIADEEREEFKGLTVESEIEQIFMFEEGDKFNILSPNKEDYINIIAKWLVEVHGKAINGGIQQ